MESQLKKPSYSKMGIGYLGKQFIRFLPLIILVIAFSVIDSVTYTYVPIFIQYIISTLTSEEGIVNLPDFVLNIFNSGSTVYLKIVYASIGLAVFQRLRAVIKVLSSTVRQLLGETLTKKIRMDLYSHIQNLPYGYHTSHEKGEIIQRCTNDIDVVRNSVCNQLPELLSIFATLISCVYQMTAINKDLTLVSLVIIPVAFVSSFIFCRYVAKKFEIIEEAEEDLTSIIENNIDNVRVVKACNNEQFEIDRFTEKNKDYAKKNFHLNLVSAYYWGFSDMTTLLQYFLTCIVAINLVRTGEASIGIGSFSAMMSLVGTYIWPVRSLGRIIGDTGKSSVSAGRIKEVLLEKDEFTTDNGTLMPSISGNIEFKNVSFKFNDTEQHLLDNVSFSIKQGETVALMGKTGSGKSTIAKLLTRMLAIHSGDILIDGISINEIEKHHLRRNVGLVLQEPFLYAKTVYENISITEKGISQDRVREVARISSVDNDINGFAEGYDTLVGEKGVTLSGGQKQRVAIARMLINNKPIIIFDDSLSALDTETDLMIREALRKNHKDTTMIVITHRISTARSADQIIVLENGTIGQIGRHDDLVKQEGLYKNLWDIQGEIEEEFLKLVNEEVK